MAGAAWDSFEIDDMILATYPSSVEAEQIRAARIKASKDPCPAEDSRPAE